MSGENNKPDEIGNEIEKISRLPEDQQKKKMAELFEKLPKEEKGRLLSSIETSRSISIKGEGNIPLLPFIADKMTEEHISQALEGQREEQQIQKELTKDREHKKFIIIMVCIFIGFFVLLGFIGALWLFKDAPNLVSVISDGFKYLISAGLGFLGGLGLGKKTII